MKNFSLIIFFLLMGFQFSFAQVTDLSFEFQAYPTGLIPGLRIEKSFGTKNTLHLRLGYQFIDHRDLGVHQNEEGSGYGFTLGYNRFLKEDFTGWHFGIRSDLWFNTIDWESSIGTAAVPFGTSEITVVQPTAQLGYLFKVKESWFFTPTISLGFEVNVKTDGEPTGEGAILLLGVNAGKRFLRNRKKIVSPHYEGN